MKSTGIVRRIDDLGRVVIPKEIRRTMRLREGDPVEIFVGSDGSVMLKKYQPMNELGDFAKEYATSLHESTNHSVLIFDTSSVLATAGCSPREYYGMEAGLTVLDAIEGRKHINKPTTEFDYHNAELIKDKHEKLKGYVVVPIEVDGDKAGAIVIFSTEGSNTWVSNQMELKMAETAASFLAKQLKN